MKPPSITNSLLVTNEATSDARNRTPLGAVARGLCTSAATPIWSASNRMNTLPDDLVRKVVEWRGAEGLEWLNRLPSLIVACSQRWSLQVLPPFQPLSYSYVAPVVRADGIRAVLKASIPGHEMVMESEALKMVDGRGAVRLLDADPDNGILLLERLEPGIPLSSLDDDEEATSIAASVMRQMWRPVPDQHPFATVSEWAGGLARLRAHFDGGYGPFPACLVDAASERFRKSISSQKEPVLLHGDLHHGNILAAGHESWLAIDPKGLVGEPEYEVGALLRNPVQQLLARTRPDLLLQRRMDRLVEDLNVGRDRVLGWGMAQAVLAAWWSFEDHDPNWQTWLACAELLYDLERNVP